MLRICGYIIVALAILVEPPSARSQDKPPSKIAALLAGGQNPVKIVCLGDSITGIYYHTGGRRAYPEMLEIALSKTHPKAKVQVINAGISGHTTVNGLARLERDVLMHKPHLVTVMFGMNDVTRVPAADFEKNLREIIARCQKIGAEVVLCTPNNVIDNVARPNKKLTEYAQIIRDLAKAEKLLVADCHKTYVDHEKAHPLDWLMWMSDEIHPNMAGHKKFAEVIAQTITGKAVSLDKVGPPQPAIPRTLAKLKAKEALKVLAMAPYDQHIGPALQAVAPGTKIEITPWPVAGKSLAEIEKDAKKVRDMKMDLVIVAVPYSAQATSPEGFHVSYSWILNWSLSFGLQEWDVVAIPPSTEQAPKNDDEAKHDTWARLLIAAQDVSAILRSEEQKEAPPRSILEQWLSAQIR